MKYIPKAAQMSESIEVGILLALAGGFLDAYSYFARGHVFANVQTGNIVLLGLSLGEGDRQSALSYFIPIVSFAVGIALAEVIRHAARGAFLHWRQFAVIGEIAALLPVGFLSADLIANSCISFACGLQLQTFGKIRGQPFATTMCTGNLRNGTHFLAAALLRKTPHAAAHSLLYFVIIITFVLGAILGKHSLVRFGRYAPFVCIAILATVCFLIRIDREKKSVI